MLTRSNRNKNLRALPHLKCAAKTCSDGQPGLSVLEHGICTAEVARELSQFLPSDLRNSLGAGILTAAAAHDVGKVSPGFQKKIKNPALREHAPDVVRQSLDGFETDHARISAAAVNAFLNSPEKVALVAKIVGMHHGSLRNGIPRDDAGGIFGGPAWAEERRRLLARLTERYGPLPRHDMPPAQAALLAGLVTVSDWIASDESFFPVEGLAPDTDVGAKAARAVRECGFHLPGFIPQLTFEQVFGFEPHPVQERFSNIVTGPGLYILEAPMGMGKTEAALYAAYRLLAEKQNTGLYFGLPTRLTSDRIHERVTQFLETVCPMADAPKLAHGKAWLKAFEHGGSASENHRDGLAPGAAWFTPRKRILLSPFAVGTIDQALLSVLRVRHYFVRTFALAGKVVILDEVHSYDMYTGTLMEEMVNSLLEIGCTVIILSATLTRQRRQRLFRQSVAAGPADSGYPLVSGEVAGKAPFALPAPPPPPIEYNIQVVDWEDREVAEIAVAKAESGHCVLLIANNVAKAQGWYDAVSQTMREDAFEIGLLHSKFPAFQREKLEETWMRKLGKDGCDRPSGCVLVATQVVEQSVDIDADFLITELAPTDMLLQRMGRQWRHPRPVRPCPSPETIVIAGNPDGAETLDELVEALGRINCLVYAPYVLWKSLQVWQGRSLVCLPKDVRPLLEATYERDRTTESSVIHELYDRFVKVRKRLADLAAAARPSVRSLPTGDDREGAATRYSDFPTTEVLLVRDVDSTGREARLVLLDGARVRVHADRPDFAVTRKLHCNTVALATYLLARTGNVATPEYLSKHFYESTPVLLLDEESGRLLLNGAYTGLNYSQTKGIFRAAARASLADSASTRYADPDWPDDLDVFDATRFDW